MELTQIDGYRIVSTGIGAYRKTQAEPEVAEADPYQKTSIEVDGDGEGHEADEMEGGYRRPSFRSDAAVETTEDHETAEQVARANSKADVAEQEREHAQLIALLMDDHGQGGESKSGPPQAQEQAALPGSLPESQPSASTSYGRSRVELARTDNTEGGESPKRRRGSAVSFAGAAAAQGHSPRKGRGSVGGGSSVASTYHQLLHHSCSAPTPYASLATATHR